MRTIPSHARANSKHLSYIAPLRQGFTIIELLIAIVIISILAVIVFVAYNGIQSRAVVSSMSSDLDQASRKLKLYQVINSAYPTSNDCSAMPAANSVCIKPSSTNVYSEFQISNISGSQAFCVAETNDTKNYYITNEGVPTAGTCADIPAAPSPPTNLTVTSSTSTSLSLSWLMGVGASGSTLQCAYDTTYTSGLVSIASGTTSGTITGLTPATSYSCRVRATNSAGTSAWSDSVRSSTTLDATTGLSVVASTSTRIDYSWSAASGATSYNIQRATDTAFTANVVTVNQAGLSGSSTGLSQGTTYYYRVQAVNAAGTGSYSSSVNATTTVDAPTGVGAAAGSSTSITVSWSGVPGATGYKIEYSPSSGFSPVYSTIVGSTSTPVGSLSQGQIWYFRVYALVGAVSSGASLVASAITPIDTPAPPSPQFGNSWYSGQYVVVNWTTYCPAGTSAANGNFTSYDWAGGVYYHAFGFNDWWYLGPGGGASVAYYARYYCAGPNANSAYSPDSGYGVWIHY